MSRPEVDNFSPQAACGPRGLFVQLTGQHMYTNSTYFESMLE